MKNEEISYWNNDNISLSCTSKEYVIKHRNRIVVKIKTYNSSQFMEYISIGIYSFFNLKKCFAEFIDLYHIDNPEVRLLITYLVKADRLGVFLFKHLGFIISVTERNCIKINNLLSDCFLMTLIIKNKE